jgi:hypothetical protein
VIAFTQFDTVFLLNPADVAQFREGQQLYLFRNNQPVSEHPMTIKSMDRAVGFIRMTEQKICKQAQRGDVLRKEVRQ